MKISDYGYVMSDKDISKYENTILTDIQKRIILNRLDYEPTIEEMNNFIYNDYDLFSDLDKLTDLDKAKELLEKHLKNKSHIAIVSDLDADGMTSAVTAYKCLRDVFKHPVDKISVLINRRKDGNSINPTLTKRIKDLHDVYPIDLITLFDHGSTSELAYQELANYGDMDFLLTDHHTVQYDIYPNTVNVFINPQRKESTYSRNISGCVTGFVTFLYTYWKMYNTTDLKPFYHIFPFPAISVISDVMSCKDPINRFIYRVGVNEMSKPTHPIFKGLRALLGYGKKITLKDIQMKIAPFINAANRTNVEDLGYEMLASEDLDNIIKLGNELTLANDKKKAVVKTLTNIALDNLKDKVIDRGVVLTIETDMAVNGLIAARVGEVKKVPVVCFIDRGNDIMSGSCRGIVHGFNLLTTLQAIKDEDSNCIVQFGGHTGACGVSITKDNFNRFKELFEKHSKIQLDTLDVKESITIDYMVKECNLTFDLVKELEVIGPYGKDWSEPTLLSIFYVDYVMVIGSMCIVMFKRVDGNSLGGFYSFGDKSGLTIDNIKEKLVRGTRCLVSYNPSLSTRGNTYDISLNIKQIDIV